MSGLKGGLAGLAFVASVAGAQAEGPKEVPAGSDGVAVTTQAATQRLMVALDTTLVAQAQISAPPESDGKEYFADVTQIDGTKRRIKYYRDKEGSIIPPPVLDGKLVDGSPAPTEAARARIAQRKILVPYDKNAQIALAMVGDKDLLGEALNYSKNFREKIESGKKVTAEEIELLMFHGFIIREAGGKYENMLKTAELLAIGNLKMTSSQYELIKINAEQKAKKIWKAATGAVA